MEDRKALRIVAERATAADPLSLWVHSLLSYAWAYAGDYQQARDVAYRSLALSGMSVSIFMLPVVLSESGRHNEALEAAQRAVDWGERSPITVAMLAHVLWRSGRRPEAQRAADEVRRMAPDHEFASLIAEAGFAGEERLAQLLRRALDLEAASTSLRIAPRLRELLSHPRLGPLVRALPTFAHQAPG
jgi:tetratricopeptide (TPR) repeat protein